MFLLCNHRESQYETGVSLETAKTRHFVLARRPKLHFAVLVAFSSDETAITCQNAAVGTGISGYDIMHE